MINKILIAKFDVLKLNRIGEIRQDLRHLHTNEKQKLLGEKRTNRRGLRRDGETDGGDIKAGGDR